MRSFFEQKVNVPRHKALSEGHPVRTGWIGVLLVLQPNGLDAGSLAGNTSDAVTRSEALVRESDAVVNDADRDAPLRGFLQGLKNCAVKLDLFFAEIDIDRRTDEADAIVAELCEIAVRIGL